MSNLYFDEGPSPLHGRKILVATTSYGSPDSSYTFSIARSREALTAAGIPSAYLLLEGFCHVDDARNAVVRNFLASDCSELLFIDADVTWEPAGLVQLASRDLDVVGGVYPYRRASENMPVRIMSGRKPDKDGLLEVEGLPTGFLKIKRHVLETLAKDSPKYFDKTEVTPLIFERVLGEGMTRWGGDINFCNRWIAAGGRIYADTEIRLGHASKTIFRDSLAAYLRRHTESTYSHIIPKIRAGTESVLADYDELVLLQNNSFVADPAVLALMVGVARKCRGPIIEAGSGLSSVLMAAANESSNVYTLEHLEGYAATTLGMAERAGVKNLGVCCAPLVDGWYDIDRFDLPQKFALGVCDGPPRLYGTRIKFFEIFGGRCTVIVADDVGDDINYGRKIHEWAEKNRRDVQMLGRAALITKREN